MKLLVLLLSSFAFAIGVSPSAVAQEKASRQLSGKFPKLPEVFEVEGHKAIVYAAPWEGRDGEKGEDRRDGKPWVWYAPALAGGVSLFGRKMYYEGFMRAGISIAGFDLGEVRGSPDSSGKFAKFYEAMVKRGWSSKPILLGQSRGGMMMLAWGMRNPEKVRAFVGIYPVCNLASWPLVRSEKETLADYQMTKEELTGRLSEFNPVESRNLKGLIEHQVPMFIVHGDNDVVVPYELNSGLLKERYEAGGGRITVKVIPGEGHKVGPSFFECRELVEFVVKSGTVNGRKWE